MLPPEIVESLQEFDRNLNTTIPLEHHWEYIDARSINCKIQTEKDKAFQNFRQVADKKVDGEKREFAEKFHSEVDKMAKAHQNKNEDLKDQAHYLLKKRREELCADFKSSSEAKLLRNQDLDLKSIEELLETGKELGKRYFEYHSNYGIAGSFNDEQFEQKELLVQELKRIEKILRRHRRRHQKTISDEEERKSLEEKSYFDLKKLMDDLCVDFNSIIKTKLLITPDMDLKSLKDLIETGTELAKSYYEYHSNCKNSDLYNKEGVNEQEQLERELKRLGNVLLRDQRHHLKSISEEKARKLLEQLNEAVLEMSEKVKADSLQWNVTRRKLKEKVQEIHTYVVENCISVLSHANNREVYSELLRLEAGDNMSANDFIKWTEGLNKEVKFDIECEMETPEMHFLDLEEGAPVVEGNSELKFSPEKVKEEVLKTEGESSDLETSHEMDIDVKLELDQLVLQKPCLKRSNDLILEDCDVDNSVAAENDVSLSKRQKVSKRQSVGGLQETGENECSYASVDEVISNLEEERSHCLDPEERSSPEKVEPEKGVSFPKKKLSNKHANSPLLRAMRKGASVKKIRKLLDNGANVNVKSAEGHEDNAAHEVIRLLIDKRISPSRALAVLNLLVEKGFNLINEGDSRGYTPLLYAMQYKNLDEDLLAWFFNNGANFNAGTRQFKNSVLFQAIFHRQNEDVLRKIIEFGGTMTYSNVFKCNVFDMSARYAHESALELFLYQFDVNGVNRFHRTLLHYLFMVEGLEYQNCVELLLKRGADFTAKCSQGYFPLVRWIKFGKGNIFSALMKTKDILPITQDIASAALTAIVEEMGRLHKFMSASGEAPNDFAQFIRFLIEEKKGTLRLKCGSKWKEINWGKLESWTWACDLLTQLRTFVARMIWKGGPIKINFNINFPRFPNVCVAVEVVMVCLLANKHYSSLVKLCQRLANMNILVTSGDNIIPENHNEPEQILPSPKESDWPRQLYLNERNQHGYAPLARAILGGQSLERIAKLLDDGADVNMPTKYCKQNTVHLVISSLICKKQSKQGALAILNLLRENGFCLINERNSVGLTPLLYAMQHADLDEELLRWFHENGADFNAATAEFGDSVLFHAIWQHQGAEILSKLIEFGSNPQFVDRFGCNALHKAAKYANASALKFFLEQLEFDVNVGDKDGMTPLHFLFLECSLNYEECLKILIQMGADFGAKNNFGTIPCVTWMKYGRADPIPILLKFKDIIPFTEDIATAILAVTGSFREGGTHLMQFITFLNEDKKGVMPPPPPPISPVERKMTMGWLPKTLSRRARRIPFERTRYNTRSTTKSNV